MTKFVSRKRQYNQYTGSSFIYDNPNIIYVCQLLLFSKSAH